MNNDPLTWHSYNKIFIMFHVWVCVRVGVCACINCLNNIKEKSLKVIKVIFLGLNFSILFYYIPKCPIYAYYLIEF